MPNVLNYAQAYAQALAQAYPYVLHFAALHSTENDSRYRWINADAIQIPSLSTTGRVDADRDTIGTAKSNFENAWEPKILANHRKWSTLVHPSAVITPEKYTFAQLDAPSAGSEGKWVYFEESYDDVFILNKRVAAIKFNVTKGA